MNRAEMLVELRRVGRLFVKNDEFAHADDSLETAPRLCGRAVDRLLLHIMPPHIEPHREALYQCRLKAGPFIS
jgi:hypothetical protein